MFCPRFSSAVVRRALPSAAALVAPRSFHSSAAAFDKILLADGIDKDAASLLKKAGHDVDERPALPAEELMDIISQYDAVVVRSASKITADVLKRASKLKVVGRAGTGVDNIDTVAASQRGILVVNTPGGNTRSAAELAVSLMTSLVRKIPFACSDLKAGDFARSKYATGTELKGKTLGLIGCGRIGQVVSQYSKALGMTVLGVDDYMSEEKLAGLGITKVDLPTLQAEADVISLHVPGGEGTKGLVNSEFLEACRPGVFVINAARGGVVNEEDLLGALDSGRVAGAALDVFDGEPKAPDFELSPTLARLATHENVICTPHLGASTQEAQIKVARDIAQQLVDGLAGLDWVGIVNAPHVSMASDPALQPWVQVANAVGSLAAQLCPISDILSVEVSTVSKDVAKKGDIAKEVMRTAVLRAMLDHVKDIAVPVNLVNADGLAQDRNWLSTASLSAAIPGVDRPNIMVTVETRSGRRTVSGSVVGGKPYITQIDEWPSFPSFKAEGSFVFYTSIDKPGMIAPVVGVLASNHINVSTMGVARPSRGRPSFVFLSHSGSVNRAVILKLEGLEGISDVTEARL